MGLGDVLHFEFLNGHRYFGNCLENNIGRLVQFTICVPLCTILRESLDSMIISSSGCLEESLT